MNIWTQLLIRKSCEMWCSALCFAFIVVIDTVYSAVITRYDGLPLGCRHYLPYNNRRYYGNSYQQYPYYGYRPDINQYRMPMVYQPRIIYVPQFVPYGWYQSTHGTVGNEVDDTYNIPVSSERILPTTVIPFTIPTTTTTESPTTYNSLLETTTNKRPFIISSDKILDTPILPCPGNQKRDKNGICREPWLDEETTSVLETTTGSIPTTKRPFWDIFGNTEDKIIDTPTIPCPKGQRRSKNGICRTPW